MSLSSVTSSGPGSTSPTSTSLSASITAPSPSSTLSLVSASPMNGSIPTPSALAASVKSVAETMPKYLIAGGVALGVVILLGLVLLWWKLKMRRNRHFDEEDHYQLERRHERLGSIPITPRRGSDQTVVSKDSLEKAKDTGSPDSEKTLVGSLAVKGLGKDNKGTSGSPPPSASTSPRSPPSLSSSPLSALDDEPYVLVSRSATCSPKSLTSPTLPRPGLATVTLLNSITPTAGQPGRKGGKSGKSIMGGGNAVDAGRSEGEGMHREAHHVPVLSRQ